ncbi:MAG TPA: hypothetical protein DCF33_14040 [Saprospirales bacterium]|nr:hypothetical protein [Saprospirales bacterium]
MKQNLLSAFAAFLIFTACQNQPAAPPAPDASALLKHKYWVNKPFHDALFAANVPDTMAYLDCGELIFTNKDTVIITSCMSDAGIGIYTVSGPNTLSIKFQGFEDKPITATLDEKTGLLSFTFTGPAPEYWPKDFIAKDEVSTGNMDGLTLGLARLRLAGNYQYQTKKGEMAIASVSELHADGSMVNFGEYDMYEPWIAGVGSSCITTPPMNLMNMAIKGKEAEAVAFGWQLHGDTLRIWDTQNMGQPDELPEYKLKGAARVYVKMR